MHGKEVEPASRADAYMMLAHLAQDMCKEVDFSEQLREKNETLRKAKEELGAQRAALEKECDDLRKKAYEYKIDNDNLYTEMAQYRQNWLDLLAKYEPKKYEEYTAEPDKTWIGLSEEEDEEY